MYTYKDAEEIRVYEDRPNQLVMMTANVLRSRGFTDLLGSVLLFRDFFTSFNNSISNSLMASESSAARKPIRADVIEVTELAVSNSIFTYVVQLITLYRQTWTL